MNWKFDMQISKSNYIKYTSSFTIMISGFSLVSIYQIDVTSFDQFLKLFVFVFFKLIWLGLELGLRLGLE